jgi:Ca-activated chloride channel family protein
VINQLSPEDYVSIVIYGDGVEVLATSNKVGDKRALQSRIDAIQSIGSTNLQWRDDRRLRASQVHLPNRLREPRIAALRRAGQCRHRRHRSFAKHCAQPSHSEQYYDLLPLASGLDFNENLMTGIAEFGSGNYYFIHHPSEITSIFQKELSGLTNVVAQNTELTYRLCQRMWCCKGVWLIPTPKSGQRVTVQLRDFAWQAKPKAYLLKFASLMEMAERFACHTRAVAL